MFVHDKDFHLDNQRLLRQFFFEKRVIFLEGFMLDAYIGDETMPMGWTCSPRGVIDQIIYLSSKSKEPIYLFINSYGGMLHIALSLHDIMTTAPAPVYTIGTGIVASAATLILSAGTQDKRFIMPYTKTMIHLPEAEFRGNPKQHKIFEKEFERDKNTYIKLLAQRSHKTESEIESLIDQQDYWMNAEETKAFGLVDHVVANFSDIGINLN